MRYTVYLFLFVLGFGLWTIASVMAAMYLTVTYEGGKWIIRDEWFFAMVVVMFALQSAGAAWLREIFKKWLGIEIGGR